MIIPELLAPAGDRERLEAALYPDSHQYYFFRHDKNGKIYMATTVEEHSANGRLVEKVNAEVD